MRPLTIIGIIILGLGAFLLIRGASFGSKKDILEVGDLKISATEKRSVPPWVGGLLVVVGGAVLVAGTRKRG
jgi:hypothetical protein